MRTRALNAIDDRPEHSYFPDYSTYVRARREPENFVDDVAVERVFSGDRSIMWTLNPVERMAVLDKVADILDTPLAQERVEKYCDELGRPKNTVIPIWDIADRLGMDYIYLRAKATNRRQGRQRVSERVA